MAEPTLITEIPKNTRETLRVSRETFHGRDLVNLRVWFRAEDGEMRPGKAGIALRIDLLDDLIGALQNARSLVNDGRRA